MDLSLIPKDEYEFRIETMLRVSHAPRRINLHMNTERTTDFHSHLKEYDIDDTTNWHKISMTTKNFDARPGDSVNAQMALIDWGLEKYRLDIGYFKVDIVKTDTVGHELGNPLPYHPPIPDLSTFGYNIPVNHDAVINSNFRNINFNTWANHHGGEKIPVLTVNGSQTIIMRWNFGELNEKEVKGGGILELTTQNFQKLGKNPPDFGLVRVVEILHGDPNWQQNQVTYASFCQGKALSELLNSQMIIDLPVKNQGKKNYFSIPEPVMQRLINGTTKGIALQALGAINASFFASEYGKEKHQPKLYFNIARRNSMLPGN